MQYVYLIRSRAYPDQTYIGMTTNIKNRLAAHNAGQSPHTAKFRPWKLVTFIGFSEKAQAVAFEKYLKTGSGRAFSEKRLWS
jgi:predicted GIY-YIG superfamily endonuclease